MGSRTLSREVGLDLSPATIRNVMSDLEELGFITSPHTSAGRIPTVQGYRFFVDTLLNVKPLDAKSVEQMRAELDIEMIAPSHGVIWRARVAEILKAYADWSVCRPKAKVFVVYDTMWESTERMAQAIHEGASQPGIEAVLTHIRRSNLTTMATEVLDTACVAFGSATLNRGMMPMAAAVLTYLKSLRPVGKAGFSFGSYGWGKGAPEAVNDCLENMGWEVLREPLKAQYRPTPEVLDECRQAGRMLADKALQMV